LDDDTVEKRFDMRELSELLEFLTQKMSGYDESVQEYYQSILMRWPKITLTRHNIVTYDRKRKTFSLNFDLEDVSLVERAKAICEEKTREWIDKQAAKSDTPRIEASKRYRVLRAAKGKCELCGISAKISPIDIDHIVPRSKANKEGYISKDGARMRIDDERNLQALCFRCNRAKRDADSTDFRMSQRKLVRDRIPEIIQRSGRTPVVKRLKGNQLAVQLKEKLTEEHAELLANTDIDEISDMIEVLLAIAKLNGYTATEVMDYL
jgi:predicted house-cleaning noncanonical NTP pyrophosphatase (MazG superfamily)